MNQILKTTWEIIRFLFGFMATLIFFYAIISLLKS